MTERKAMYVVYYTIYGPLIQVAVSKAKGYTALTYKQKVFKTLESFFLKMTTKELT